MQCDWHKVVIFGGKVVSCENYQGIAPSWRRCTINFPAELPRGAPDMVIYVNAKDELDAFAWAKRWLDEGQPGIREGKSRALMERAGFWFPNGGEDAYDDDA